MLGLRSPAEHERMDDCGTMNHEGIGAAWLAGLGFPAATTEVVRRHVDAKRFLTDPALEGEIFGPTSLLVVAENEDVLANIGWPPNCTEFGFAAGTNALSVGRYTGGNHISSISGSTPEAILQVRTWIVEGQLTADIFESIEIFQGAMDFTLCQKQW
jgi:hypothetical protein